MRPKTDIVKALPKESEFDLIISSSILEKEKKERALPKARNRIVASIPKKNPLIFKPVISPILVNVLRVEQKVFIVPDDLLPVIEGSNFGRYLRHRWVFFALFPAKKRKGSNGSKVKIVELLPSLFKEMIKKSNDQSPHKISENYFGPNAAFVSLAKEAIVGSNSMNYLLNIISSENLRTKHPQLTGVLQSWDFDKISRGKDSKFNINSLRNFYFTSWERAELEVFIKERIYGEEARTTIPLLY